MVIKVINRSVGVTKEAKDMDDLLYCNMNTEVWLM